MKATRDSVPVRDRILAVAMDLFYRQGYRATGINQIIAASGVAKASFYDHFPSKTDLLHAYTAQTSRHEMADLKDSVDKLPTARERFFGPLNILPPWLEMSAYRGCPFQNIMADVGFDDPVVLAVSREHRELVRVYFRELAEALLEEEPALAPLDTASLADTYLLLFEGVLVMAPLYRDPWPVNHAVATLARLLSGD